MRAVLDEAAGICKIADLPAVYSPRPKGHRAGVILGPYHQKRGAGSTWTLCGAPSTLLTGPLVPSMDGNPWALAAEWGSCEIQDVRGTSVCLLNQNPSCVTRTSMMARTGRTEVRKAWGG